MTYTGPFPFDNTGTLDGILIATSFTGTVNNLGVIITNGISVVGSTVTGTIASSGNLAGGINVDRAGAVTAGSSVAILGAGNLSGGIHNGGTLTGTYGIRLVSSTNLSGVVSNTGSISATIGIETDFSGASIFDSGTITGTTTAIAFAGSHNTMTLGAGYNITGIVNGTGSDTLQLGGSGSATFDPGKIGGAQQYRGFSTFTVVGGTWTLTGAAAQAWTIKAGTLDLGSGASIVNKSVTFAGSGATLQIDTGLAQISGSRIFGAGIGDAIDLRFQAFSAGVHASWQQVDPTQGTLTVADGNGTVLATLGMSGVYAGGQFQAADDGNGGTSIQITAPQLPTLSVQNAVFNPVSGNLVSLASMVSITDPNNLGYRQLQLWDTGGVTQLFNSGGTQASGREVDVPSAYVSTQKLLLGGSAGTDTLWARLLQNNGNLTPWQQFTVVADPEVMLTASSVSSAVQSSTIPLLGAGGLITLNNLVGTDYQQLHLWDSNGTVAGGYFKIGSQAQTGGHEIDLTPAQAATTNFIVGTTPGGTDTLWAQVLENDGTLTPWQQFTVTVPAPTLTVQSGIRPAGGFILQSGLLTISDPGNVVQQLQLWHGVGGTGTLRYPVDQPAGQEIDVVKAAVGAVSFVMGSSVGTDTLWARLKLTDGSLTPWQQFTETVAEASLTTNTITNAVAGHSILLRPLAGLPGLLTVNDPSIVSYQKLVLWDSVGGAGGRFVLNGVPQSAGQEIDLTPQDVQFNVLDFSAATVVGTDTLWARLQETDGTFSEWQKITVTVPNPTLTVQSVANAAKTASIPLSQLVTISEYNVGYQQLQLWDSKGTAAGGQLIANGSTQGSGEVDIAKANVGSVTYTSGSAGGTDTLWARLKLNDGSLTAWQQFSVTVPQPTVSAVQSTTAATEGQSINLSSLISIADPSGVGYATLELWEAVGGAGGQFAISGMMQTAGHEIDVPIADIADTVFNAGATAGATDQLWAQLKYNDGTVGGWVPFTVTTAPAPTLNVNNYSGADAGQFIPLASLLTVSDPGHENYQTLRLYESVGAGGNGVFDVHNVAQSAGQSIDLSFTGASTVGFTTGALGVTDRLWAQLVQNDGTATAWQQFTVSTHA